MEAKHEMREPDKVRFTILLCSILYYAYVFFYAKELVGFEPIADTMADAYVDGADVTDICKRRNLRF